MVVSSPPAHIATSIFWKCGTKLLSHAVIGAAGKHQKLGLLCQGICIEQGGNANHRRQALLKSNLVLRQ